MACCDTGPGGFGSTGGRGGLDCVPILAPPNGMVLNTQDQTVIDSLLDRREKTTFHLLAFPEGVRIEKNKYIGKGFMTKKQKISWGVGIPVRKMAGYLLHVGHIFPTAAI